MLCCQARCSHTFRGGCGARRTASRADLAHLRTLRPPPRVAAFQCHRQAPAASLASRLFTNSPVPLSLPRLGGFHTHPRGGKAAVAASPACFGGRAGGGFHNSVESLGNQLLCGRVEFHPQNTYGETNWKLQRNMQNLHCASFRGTTRIPVKFINTVRMQSIELSK